jgi:tetratricopeptide (TPR) repeat protein
MVLSLDNGIALHKRGRLAEAQAIYEAVLSSSPEDASALHYLGLAHYQSGRNELAERCMNRSLEIDPSCANTWSDLGVVSLKSGKPEESLRLFTRALELQNDHLDALNNMAVALKQLHRFEKAAVLLRRLAELRPSSAEAARSLGDALFHSGAVSESVEAYQDSLRLDPNSLAARLGMAEACESAGRFRQAKLQYLAVLRRDPDNAMALAKLLQMRDGKTEKSWVVKAEQLARDDSTVEAAKARLNIALSYHYDQARLYDGAFRCLKLGRDVHARAQPFSSEGYSKAIDTLIECLTPEFFRSAATSGITTTRPIVIIGMPRSGTTLTEQILASHSLVAAGGELPALPEASYRIAELSGGHKPYPQGLRSLRPAALELLGRQYLKQLSKVDRKACRVTDKLPFNFMHLGTLALILPGAKVVHCRRDPLDNCVSCYFTSFAEEVGFANDLGTLGRYYADYARLMRHWKGALPLEIFELRYEELVSDTRACIGRLLEFCELEWEESCMRFHETRRGVRTPSRWQVRQPIYGHSVQRWRHYEQHLQPLKDALGALAFGPAASPDT